MKLEALQALALAVAGERVVETVLQTVVRGLAQQPQVALARIWLITPGDICAACPMRTECPDQTRCLHLVASAGKSRHRRGEEWSRLDGDFRRFPLTRRKIGQIGATGDPVLLSDIAKDAEWIARPEWAKREGIRSFAGQPLIFRGEILGVLAVFRRAPLDTQDFTWLRMFADQAAAALATARAFEEIERLRQQLELENSYLREEVRSSLAFGDIIGQSPALQKVLTQIELVAPTDANILILGESGTGKELIARAIHERSLRRDRPLVKVNCGAIPQELFESEFFGHVKGAFTGALHDRLGRFQVADKGTLFLDEVGEIPLELQSKLLRVLQDGQFERVGDDVTRQVDVRLIAATNRDVPAEIAAGRFRQDLYYRLSVFPLEVPPLRQRTEDIPLLAAHFVREACRRLHRPEAALTPHQVRLLQQYDWPGNIRELQHVIERAVILSRDARLRLDLAFPENPQRTTRQSPASHYVRPTVTFVPEAKRKQGERDNLIAALTQARGKVYGRGGAAELLGVKPTTLASRLKALGIKRPADVSPAMR
jgi:transcriptional regulator with GAF, ATPase, and Fis domain